MFCRFIIMSRSFKILQMCNPKTSTSSLSENSPVEIDSDEQCGTQSDSVQEDSLSREIPHDLGLDLQETTFFPASEVPVLCTTEGISESNEVGKSVILIPDNELLNLISLATSTTQDNNNTLSSQKDDDLGLNTQLELGQDCVLNSVQDAFLDIPLHVLVAK